MASNSRVVCWLTREEWMETYQNLFNFEKPDLQRKGTDRVAAWKSRSGGKLPLAIESTSNLIAAHLAVSDPSDGSDASPVSSGFVQKKLILAMALVRFVNGMVDLEQKGVYARSMQAIAEEIGLPDWLIDLRHEATHAGLPSLETLLSGLQVALSWLRGEYWEAQITKHDLTKGCIVQLLKDYKDRAMLDLGTHAKKQSKKIKVNKKSESLKDSSTEIVQEITSLASSRNSWSEIISTLLDKNLLSCSQEDLAKIEVEWSEPIENETNCLPRLPSKVIDLWKPLFEALHKVSANFLPSLVIGLLEHLPGVGGSQLSDVQLAGWVNCLLASALSPSSVDLLAVTEDLPWSVLLEKSLRHVSPYSPAIVSVVLQNMPEVPCVLQQKIKTLVSVYLHTNDDLQQHTGKHYSVDDLDELITRKRSRTGENKKCEDDDLEDQQEMWSLSSGHLLWHKVPLGEVLGVENESSNNLELFQELVDTGVAVQQLDDARNDEELQGYSTCFVEDVTDIEVITDDGVQLVTEAPGDDLVTNGITLMETETVENSDDTNIADSVWLL